MVVDLPSLSSLTIGTGAFSNTHHFDIHQFPNSNTHHFDIHQFPNLISLTLGYDIIDGEDSFELNGHSKLTEFRCLQPKYRDSPVETNETKSFRIINCSALKDIYLFHHCFADYGQFEVSNCPALISLTIASFWNTVAPFIGSSFSVRGNKHRGFLLVDCPSLSSIKINEGVFNQSLAIVMESSNRTAYFEE